MTGDRNRGGFRAGSARAIRRTVAALLWLLACTTGLATPPYRDLNQPYDRLPGTLETGHVPWARPSAAGKLNVLFIIPYNNSREVIEAAQRLEMNYTVIMNASPFAWEAGYFEGANATPLKGLEARTVLNEITHKRLRLAAAYDAIVIAKISWAAMPDDVRQLILKHVERGTGLVYVGPNRCQPAENGRASQGELAGQDPEFTALTADTIPGVGKTLLDPLPRDVMRLYVLDGPGGFRPLPAVQRTGYQQAPVCITATHHGKGRVLALRYFDEMAAEAASSASLSYFVATASEARVGHNGDHDAVIYDYAFALLTKCLLWSAAKEPAVRARVTFQVPPTALKPRPLDSAEAKCVWEPPAPETVMARGDLPKGTTLFSAVVDEGAGRNLTLRYAIRDLKGRLLTQRQAAAQASPGRPATLAVPLPRGLARGTYVADLRVLDHAGRVVDFASRSFRVESPLRITSISTEKDAYRDGQTIAGSVALARPLAAEETLQAWAVDTWGRTVARGDAALNPDRCGGRFTLRVHRPLGRLWDVACAVRDAAGEVDQAKTWVGLPNWISDDYMFMLIFTSTPGYGGWKGSLYGNVMRRYGINATFTNLIFNDLKQYELNERYHLQSVSYAEHLGESEANRKGLDPSKEYMGPGIAEISRMCRHIAHTGTLLDPKIFTDTISMGAWSMDARWINGRIPSYQATARFGSPMYALTGENYLLGEFRGEEYSGFPPLTTKRFQDWCRQQYRGSLGALNAEWGSRFESWDQVRGILLTDAVEKKQLPRWVDFRYFMRSQVWSGFFLDWSDMMRRFVPEIRTGKLGHEHHDFSRYRDNMGQCKLYIGQVQNTEWREALVPELYQSFTGDRSFLMASQSMIRWSYDMATPVDRLRWPWKALFLGLRGFDWEQAGAAPHGFVGPAGRMVEGADAYQGRSALLEAGQSMAVVGLHSPYAGLFTPGDTYVYEIALKGQGVFHFRAWMGGIDPATRNTRWLGFPDLIKIRVTGDWRVYAATFSVPRCDQPPFTAESPVSAALVVEAGDKIYLDNFRISTVGRRRPRIPSVSGQRFSAPAAKGSHGDARSGQGRE